MNNLREKIIKALSDGQELSGGEIAKAVRCGVMAIHPTLWQLESEGIISARWSAQRWATRKGNRRRLYKLSEVGA